MDDDPFNREVPENLQKGLAFAPNELFSIAESTASSSIRLCDYQTSQWGSRFQGTASLSARIWPPARSLFLSAQPKAFAMGQETETSIQENAFGSSFDLG
ncbi:hypothetical protein IV203_024366 [Nitzschia inconspicua]|uniref:Uncharacterized protein n=1 Tax=Nitzschia inconspicua TaxID=303405 RepID=A0A9K3KC60_9STRA|nr:hypothetical protein IV203_024366 [Nitzschia inconspicua]